MGKRPNNRFFGGQMHPVGTEDGPAKQQAAARRQRHHLVANLFIFFANLLPSALSRQGLFDSALCAGLEVEGVALHFLNDVFRLNLTLEATESAFY
jgi:hypothetical protein